MAVAPRIRNGGNCQYQLHQRERSRQSIIQHLCRAENAAGCLTRQMLSAVGNQPSKQQSHCDKKWARTHTAVQIHPQRTTQRPHPNHLLFGTSPCRFISLPSLYGTHSFSAFVHGKSPAFYFAATYSILRATSLSPDCSVRTTNATISLYRSKHLPQRTRIHPALLRCREPRLFDVSPPPSRALTTDGPGLAPHNTGAIRGQ